MVRSRVYKTRNSIKLTPNRVSVVISLQNWLAETPEQAKSASTPSYMSVFMSRTSGPVPIFFPSSILIIVEIVMAMGVVRFPSSGDLPSRPVHHLTIPRHTCHSSSHLPAPAEALQQQLLLRLRLREAIASQRRIDVPTCNFSGGVMRWAVGLDTLL